MPASAPLVGFSAKVPPVVRISPARMVPRKPRVYLPPFRTERIGSGIPYLLFPWSYGAYKRIPPPLVTWRRPASFVRFWHRSIPNTDGDQAGGGRATGSRGFGGPAALYVRPDPSRFPAIPHQRARILWHGSTAEDMVYAAPIEVYQPVIERRVNHGHPRPYIWSPTQLLDITDVTLLFRRVYQPMVERRGPLPTPRPIWTSPRDPGDPRTTLVRAVYQPVHERRWMLPTPRPLVWVPKEAEDDPAEGRTGPTGPLRILVKQPYIIKPHWKTLPTPRPRIEFRRSANDQLALAVRGVNLVTPVPPPMPLFRPRTLLRRNRPDDGRMAFEPFIATIRPIPAALCTPRQPYMPRLDHLAMNENDVRPKTVMRPPRRDLARFPRSPVFTRRVRTATGENDHFIAAIRIQRREPPHILRPRWSTRPLFERGGVSGPISLPGGPEYPAWVAAYRGTLWVVSRRTVLVKDPDESREYAFDFELQMAAGETIASATVSASGLTIGSPSISGSQVRVRISGGTAGTQYTLTCDAITTNDNPVRATERLSVYSVYALSPLAKKPAELRGLDFDFRSLLAAGENIESATIAAVSGLTIGTPIILPPGRVQASYSSGSDGTQYAVPCTVTTNLTNTLKVTGKLSVFTPS